MDTTLRFRGRGQQTFHNWLKKLKQRGSNLLVTGDVPETVSAEASRTLFGSEGRYRILGVVDETIQDPTSRLPEYASTEDERTWVVDHRDRERSAAVACGAATGTGATHAGPDQPERTAARRLCEEIQAAIGSFEERADGFEAAQLRVGVDSLAPLLQEDPDATRRTLRTLAATVRGVDGMAHYHLRVPDDDEVVEELMPLFDARIELRKRPSLNPEQRWHVPDLDATTTWVEL